ncbi:MAG TPA: VWA domain-containing protein, partial [Epsilonproteobacteria bacterium]|nr:VWA domain-containing protein [Campylobacterota bacterium]
MKLNSIIPKVHNTFILFAAISILIFSSSIAQAENWGVATIQSTHSYGSTIPIASGTIGYLQKNGKTSKKYIADDTRNTRVSSVLNNLKNNDVLIINTHSNAMQFGAGSSGVEWADFYNYWGTRKPPPKLGLVIIHGCIFSRDSQGNDILATDRQIQDIRKSLNADAIISFNSKVNPLVGRISLHQLIVGILKGHKIASLIHGRNLRFLVDSQIDRDNVTLADLTTQQQFLSDPGGGNLRESILIVLDASGSMSSQGRIEKARDAARRVLQGITAGGDTEVGLITFSGCGHVKVAAEFTTDPQKIIAILPQIRPSGGTPLATATAVGKKYLREKSRGAKKRFILLTDGKESCNG